MASTRIYTSVLLRNRKGELLTIQRVASARFAPGQWEFINGTIEPHETAEETAIREVSEETGLQLTLEQLVSAPIHELTDTDGRWVVIPFRVETTGDIRLSEEHQASRWASEEEILSTPYVSDAYQALLEAESH